MIKNKITLSIASAIFMAGFAGCGSDTQTNTLRGQVIGSHYEGAKICQDTNENYKCDTNEPSVLSDANGVFELEHKGDYPVLAEIGVDTKKHSNGVVSSVVNPITFITMPEGLSEDGKLMLSTVSTTIVAQMISKKLSFENAKMVTALLSGIDTQDILENFVDGGELNVQQKQVLQTIADAYLLSLQQANGFTSFVAVQGSTKTVWRDAAINWTATTGLNFVSSELTSLLGIGTSDPYSQNLSEMITQLTEINEELQQQTALLTNMDSTLTKIYDFALSSSYKSSIDVLKINHDKLNTQLINLRNFIGNQTNEEILASEDTLQNLATILTKENMDFMGTYSRMLAGKDGINASSSTMNNFLQARLSYRDESSALQNSDDLVAFVDSSNDALMAQYIIYLQDMQAVYLVEMLSIYISKNAKQITNPQLQENFSRLFVNEVGLFTSLDQSESYAKLNEITKEKFESIRTLFKNKPANGVWTNWISDSADSSMSGEFTSLKEYKNILPTGDWQKEGEVYVWNKISDNPFTGFYNQEILTVRKGSTQSSLNILECDDIENFATFTTSASPYLVCNELSYRDLMGTKNSSNYGYTVKSAYTRPNLDIKKVEFNAKRITVPQDATHAIDSSGKIKYKKHSEQHQILQYNFHNAEKVLFQFATDHHHKFGGGERVTIGVDCGVAKGAYVSSCTKVSSRDPEGPKGGHSVITLKSKSGQEVMIKIGGRGTDKTSNTKAYMDTCEAPNINQSTCRDDT